ncbi:MAG TPA: GerMN domain-containing protein [Acetivibrio sp.]|uniref:GerMN domain-containing protein n=1 Tax=Acetivibrio sp. TaxID=1872092 RepID=UPI002C1E08E1|nr:GerMN domain-containing protein [Acetivibrio sp.]HOM01658.1 GerMN domain-containing protein [Acetivibrio sp.]
MKRILTAIIAFSILVFAAGCSLSGGSGTGQAGNEQQQQNDLGNGSQMQEADLEKESEKDTEEEPEKEETLTVTVYFGDFQSEKVAPETRTVKVKAGESIEKAVFEELAKGPKSEELDPVISEGTKLLSVKTENGICTLNLSKEFVENHIGGSTAELMTINSIVASLTELPGINKVQFLIEGNVREFFIHEALDAPIGRNESIIKK